MGRAYVTPTPMHRSFFVHAPRICVEKALTGCEGFLNVTLLRFIRLV